MKFRPFSCVRKRRYYAETDAQQALQSLRKSCGASTVEIYKCSSCNHYHLGNKKLYTMNYEQLLKYAEELEEKLESESPK